MKLPKTEEELQDLLEESYINGERHEKLNQLRNALRDLGYEAGEDIVAQLSRVVSEREETIIALRQVCQDHGSTDWNHTLHMADIVNKHLANHLNQP